uniref:Uncharacterized protein n=1 Tax=Panagrolaimus sp. PS1159 TaxID=55785 RepID=A0AC35F8Z8_9BILA
MWTTVFSEDSEQQQNEDKHDYSTYGQPSDISEDKWESQQKDIPLNEEDVEQRYNNLPEPPSSQNYVSPEQQNNLISMYGKINDANYDIQMDDPMSPTFALSSSQAAAQKSAPIPIVILQKQQEIVEVELPNVPNIRRQEHYQQQNIPNPPEIKVTIHEEKDKDKGSDEESEEETSPSSDEDDYPDQIIEAPSAPSMSFTEMEHERETQSAFAQEVLQQIQSFGESANDEFDVQWAKKIPPQQQQQLQQQKQQKEENRQKIPTTLP